MVNFEDLDKERIAVAERILKDKANTLGKDGSIVSEPFSRIDRVALSDVMTRTPSAANGLIPPDYDDLPAQAAVGTRYEEYRLHSYLPSGLDGPTSVQTFITISSAPDSHSTSDIEAVRVYPLISPKYSQSKSNAAHEDPNFRGFELVLYPAKSNGGPGIALVADTDKPISPVTDPGAGPPDDIAPGVGTEGNWSVDYEAGVVRFSRAPLNGPNGVMNPNNVYGDLEGLETSDAYGTITMFATFYHYTGNYGTSDNLSFVTVGDGYVSSGIFTGQSHDTVQAAINSLPENGGTVFIKEGTYDFIGKVTVPQNVRIFGLGGSVIIRPPTEPAFFIQDGYVTIEGLEIQPRRETIVTEAAAIELGSSQSGEEIRSVVIKNNIIYGQDDAPAIGFASEFNCTYKFLKITNNFFEQGDNVAGITYIGGRALGGLITFKDCEISGNHFGKTNTTATTDYSIRLLSTILYPGGTSTTSTNGFRIIDNHMRDLNIVIGDSTITDIYNLEISRNYCKRIEINSNYLELLKVNGNTVFNHSSSEIQIYADDIVYFNINDNIVENSILVNPSAGTSIFTYSGTVSNNTTDSTIEFDDTNAGSELDDTVISGNHTYYMRTPRLWACNISGNFTSGLEIGATVATSQTIRYSTISGNQLYTDDLIINNAAASDTTSSITYSSSIVGNAMVSLVIYGQISEQVTISSNEILGSMELRNVSSAFGEFVTISSNYVSGGMEAAYIYRTSITGNSIGWFSVSSDISNCAIIGNTIDGSSTIQGIMTDTLFNSNVALNTFNSITTAGLTRCQFKDNIFRSCTWNIAYAYDGDVSGTEFSGNQVGTVNIGIAGVNRGNFLESKFNDGYITASLNITNIIANSEISGNNIIGTLSLAPSSTITDSIISFNHVTGVTTMGVTSNTHLNSNIFPFGGYPSINTYADGYFMVAVGDLGKVATSHNGVTWTQRTSELGTGLIIDIAYDGKGRWVAVGFNGSITTSTNGIGWGPVSSFGAAQLQAVAHDKKGTWVAVGDGIATSPDGINWTVRIPSTGLFVFTDIAHDGKDLWIATGDPVGVYSTIVTSPDGINWTPRNVSGFGAGDYAQGVAHNGKDLWIVVGNNGKIATSLDGINWIAQTSGTASGLNAIAHNGLDLWVAGGSGGITLTSPDGINWTQQASATNGTTIYGLAHNGKDLWIATGATGRLGTSTDGVNWIQQTSSFGTDVVYGIAFISNSNAGVVGHGSQYGGTGVQGFGHGNSGIGGEFFGGDGYAVGVKGVSGALGGVGVQGHGVGTFGIGGEFFGAGHGGGLYAQGGTFGNSAGVEAAGSDGYFIVAVGNVGKIITSTNGIDWVQPASSFNSANIIEDIHYDGIGTWVACGQNGQLAVSKDGITWTQQQSALNIFGADSIRAIEYNNGLWMVGGGSGKIATSSDGINWTLRTNSVFGSGDLIISIKYGKNMWLATSFGTPHKFAVSYDGINWTRLQYPLPLGWANVIEYNGKDLWVLAGANGAVASSVDGINWRQGTSGTASTINDVAYNGKDLWVLVADSGFLATSTDGINWTQQLSSFGTNNIIGIVHNGKDLWIAGGASSTIATSADGVNWIQQSNPSSGVRKIAVLSNSNAGLVAHGSQYNGTGVQAFGHGNNGIGVEGFGGDGYAVGVKGVSGIYGGAGVQGQGIGGYATGGEFYSSGAAPGIISSGTGTMYVAVGSNGKIFTSLNGVDWAQRASSFSTGDIFSVAYNGKNLWIAVGSSGQMVTSSDGITWSQVPAASTFFGVSGLLSIKYDYHNLWIVTGVSGLLSTSTDGINWRSATSGFGTSGVNAVAHNGRDLWVAVGDGGKIATSQDGLIWTQSASSFAASDSISAIAHDNRSLWAAVSNSGALATSPDGYYWTQQYNATTAFGGNVITDIAHNGLNLWVAVGLNNTLATSPDGVTWTPQVTGFTGGTSIYAITYDGKMWIAAGSAGQLATSTDGVHWVQQTTNFGIVDIIYDVSSLYGSNAGLIARGSAYDGSGIQAFGGGFRGIGVEGFGGDGYGIGVKGVGGIAGGTGVIGYGGGYDGYGVIGIGGSGMRFDGFTVAGDTTTSYGVGVLGIGRTGVIGVGTRYGEGVLAEAGDGYGAGLRSIGGTWGGPGVTASSNGTLYLAVGTMSGAAIGIYSTDGMNWSISPGGFDDAATDVMCLAYNGKDLWMAAGELGKIWTSKDGLSWNEIPSSPYGTTTTITQLEYGNGRWVTFALRNVNLNTYDILTYSSTDDGVTWIQGAIPYTNAEIVNSPGAINDLAYNGKDLWVAVGGTTTGGTASGRVFNSKDGIIWTQIPRNTVFDALDISCVVFDNDLWLAGTESGRIASSSDGLIWTQRASLGNNNITDIAFNGKDLWVAVGYEQSTFDGKIYTSPDGFTWTLQYTDTTTFGFMSSVVYSGDRWTVGGYSGGGAVVTTYSFDGVTWATPLIGPWMDTISTIVVKKASNAGIISTGSFNNGAGVQSFGGGLGGSGVEGFGGDGYAIGVMGTSGFLGGAGVRGVGQGSKGYGGEFIGSGFHSGVDAISGLSGAAGITSSARGQFAMAVGQSGKLATSSDGYNWQLQNIGGFAGHVFGVEYDGRDTWVIGIQNGTILWSKNDGLTWNTVLNHPFSAGTDSVIGIGHDGEGLWVAVGSNGIVAYTRDVRNWSGLGATISGIGTNALNKVVHNKKDMWVLVGVNGSLANSPDGINWTSRTSTFGATIISDVAYNGKDTWMIVGQAGRIATSTDNGNTWTTVATISANQLRGVAHNGKDLWVVVGEVGEIWTSSDTINWVRQYHGFESTNIWGVDFNGKDQWIAVGDSGKIAVSQDAVFWNILPDSALGGTSGVFGTSLVYDVVFKHNSNAGIIAIGGSNGTGVQGIGGGNLGIGVEGFGGDGYGVGIKGVGGTAGGTGVIGFGGGEDGYGIIGIGGAGNGQGILAYGNGTGNGAIIVGGTSGYGLIATGSTNKSAIKIMPQAEPSVKSMGDMYVDTAGQLKVVDASSQWRTYARRVHSYAATSTGSDRLTASTTLTAFANGSIVIPANTLTVGSVIRVRAAGNLALVTAGGTVTIRVRIEPGSDDIFVSDATAVTTNNRWMIDVSAVVGVGGSSGGMSCTSFWGIGPDPTTITGKIIGWFSGTNFTTDLTLSLMTSWLANDANDQIDLNTLVIEIL